MGPAAAIVCPFCGKPVEEPGTTSGRRVLRVGKRVPWARRSPRILRRSILSPHRRCERALARLLVSHARRAAPLADLRPVFERALEISRG